MQHLLLIEDRYKNIEVGDRIEITDKNFKHLIGSLRMRVGDELTISNGQRYDFHSIIEIVEKNRAVILVKSRNEYSRELPVHITLFQGMPKGDKFEYIVQKCTELGVAEVVPVNMKRSVAIFKENKIDKKIDRLNEIILNASHQSKRQSMMMVKNPCSFKQSLALIDDYDMLIVAYENEDKTVLDYCIDKIKENNNIKVGIYIGPEGGFDEEEIRALKDKGAYITSLGKRILRTETASITLISFIMLNLEN